ncbi:YybH family protein [Roseobacter sp. EG26]|uniref:YybH family protein n=1 Tax=Roseobacter sp. EG26 TaxID=3412477 RepID=UPI003CE5838A
MRLHAPLIGLALATLAALPAMTMDTEARQAFTAYNDRFNEIAESYDLEAFLALYNKAPLWIAPAEQPVEGLDVPAGTFGFIVKNEGEFSHSFDHLFLSDDRTQAVMIGDYDLNVERADVAATGTYLFVLEKNGDGWEIVVDMYNQHQAE